MRVRRLQKWFEKAMKEKEKKEEDIPTIQISKNKFGNYEHNETGFVFSKADKSVIGKQKDDGTIIKLTEVDIEQCNIYKFTYTCGRRGD